MKKLLTSAFLLFIFLVFPRNILAGDIVINEFLVEPSSGQWVELYNKGSSTVDISGWFIDDNGGSQKYTISSGTTIAPGEFKTFDSNLFNFNVSSSDAAQLLNGSTVEDSYSYDKSPGSGYSFGRLPDGGNWTVFSTPTKGSSNNNSSPVPSPTPTPTPSPTPTPTPNPSPTPSSTPTPASVKSPSPLPSPEPTPTDSVLGENAQSSPSPQDSPTPSPSPKPSFFGDTKTKAAFIISGTGIILIAASGAFYFWYRKLNGKDLTEETPEETPEQPPQENGENN